MRLAVVGFLVAALAAASPARPACADAAPQSAALVHLDRGVALFRTNDFAAARAELLVAQRLAPDKPNPYRWLALTDVQLGDCPGALTNIAEFLARVPPDDDRRAEMLRLRELCGRTGSIEITSTPGGATVTLDGDVVGSTPTRATGVTPGTHALTAELEGHVLARRSVVVTAGTEVDLAIALTASRPALTQRAWFWPVIGGLSLAAVAIGIYAIAEAGEDSSATVLPPIQCDASGCR